MLLLNNDATGDDDEAEQDADCHRNYEIQIVALVMLCKYKLEEKVKSQELVEACYHVRRERVEKFVDIV